MEGYNPVDIRDTVLVELWTWINYEGIDLKIWRRLTPFLSSQAGKHEAYSHLVKNHQLTYPNQNVINGGTFYFS